MQEVRRPISYYDSVKDNVKGNKDTSKPSFDTLREAAEENTQSDDEREGDDTEIEVLEDGLQQKSRKKRQKQQSPQKKRSEKSRETGDSQESNPMVQSSGSGSADTEALEEKLDTMIEQNRKIIEILESFGS